MVICSHGDIDTNMPLVGQIVYTLKLVMMTVCMCAFIGQLGKVAVHPRSSCSKQHATEGVMSLICSRVCVGMVAYTQVHTNCLHMYIPYYHPTCLCVPVCVRVYMMLVHVLAGSRWSISVYGCSGRRSHIPSPHLSLEHLPFPSLPSLSNCPSSLLHTHTHTHTQVIPTVSSVPFYTTLIPLVFVLAVTAIKDAFDDIVSSLAILPHTLCMYT